MFDPRMRDDVLYFMEEGRSLAPLPDGVKASVEFVDGGRAIPVAQSRFIIGRVSDDLSVNDKKVSERHAAIGYFEGIFFILDLGSKNKTFVNERPIVESILKDGDVIRIGSTKLIFNVKGSPVSSINAWPDDDTSVSKILNTMLGRNTYVEHEEPTRILMSEKPVETLVNPSIQVTLHVSQKGRERSFKFVQPEIVIGRERGDLTLREPEVSRRHALIDVYGIDAVFIKEVESTNGIVINGKKAKRGPLRNGDILTIGTSEIRVEIGPTIEKELPRQTLQGLFMLKVVSGRVIGKNFELPAGVWTLGGGGNGRVDIDLQDPQMNKPHARLYATADKLQIEDLGEVPNTLVNGKPIKKCVIDVGDEIRFGTTAIKIVPLKGREPGLSTSIRSIGHKVED